MNIREYLRKYILLFLSCIFVIQSCQLPNTNNTVNTSLFNSKTISCHSWKVRSFHNDNDQTASVNGHEISSLIYNPNQDSGKIDIGKYLTAGSNTVNFFTGNLHDGSPHTWGYEVYKDNEKVFDEVGGNPNAMEGDTHSSSYTIQINSLSEVCIEPPTLEEDCQNGDLEACDALNEKNNPTSKPIPKPSSSSDNDCDNPNAKSINPSSFPNMSGPSFTAQSFNTKGFKADTMLESMNHLIDVLQRVKAYQSQYDYYNQNGDIAKRDEINLDLQKYISERNTIAPDILVGLNSYKNYLRNQVNILMEDNTFSVDVDYSDIDLIGYQDIYDSLDLNFKEYIDDNNTYSLLNSISILADEVQLVYQLIDDILNNKLTDIPHNSQLQVLKYLSNKVSFHKDKLNICIVKLNDLFNLQIKSMISILPNIKAENHKISTNISNLKNNINTNNSTLNQIANLFDITFPLEYNNVFTTQSLRNNHFSIKSGIPCNSSGNPDNDMCSQQQVITEGFKGEIESAQGFAAIGASLMSQAQAMMNKANFMIPRIQSSNETLKSEIGQLKGQQELATTEIEKIKFQIQIDGKNQQINQNNQQLIRVNEAKATAQSQFDKGNKIKTNADNNKAKGIQEVNKKDSAIKSQTRSEIERGIRKLERVRQEHIQKLADYKTDPDKYDNLGILKNISPQERVKKIAGRINSIEKQIKKQTMNIEQLNEELNRRDLCD